MSADAMKPVLRRLAHNDSDERAAAFLELTRAVKKKKSWEKMEMLKLWKGLFYALWMLPKRDAQNELSIRTAELVHSFSKDNGILFLRCFFETMTREWPGIDQHRLDKFYTLIRRVMRQLIVFLQMRNFAADEADHVAAVLEDTLQPKFESRGVALHVIDVLLPELLAVLRDSKTMPEQHDTLHAAFQTLAQPMVALLTVPKLDQRVFDRVVESVFIPLVQGFPSEDHDSSNILYDIVYERRASWHKLFVSCSETQAVTKPRQRDLADLAAMYSN